MTAGMTAAPPPIRFRLAGVFGVDRAGEALEERELGSRKARTLLKLLAVHRGHVVPIDTIIEVLWPDEPPRKPTENVATLVSRLRSVLGGELLEGGRGGYRLALADGARVDLDDAARLVEEAESRIAAGEPALALTAARAALGIVGAGRLLEEEADAPWAADAERELERLARASRRAAWRAALDLGEPRVAVEPAEEAVAADSLDEEAHRALIEAHYRAGEPGEALAAYERLRTTLVEELGADPAPESQELYERVLREEPLDADPHVAAAPGVARARAATTAAPASGFVGRDAELNRLSDLWAAATGGTGSCVLLSGQSGIGKTRLAQELAWIARATGGVVVQARCYEAERSLFLEPFVEIVRSLAATLPPDVLRHCAGESAGTLGALVPEVDVVLRPHGYELAAAEIERRRSFEAVTALLRRLSRRQPLLCVLDDLQHAGESTVELLHFLLRRASTDPLLVVATVRADEGAAAVSQLNGVAAVLRLGPLPADAVAVLADEMGVAEHADEVMRRTRGHTLFVLEALRAAAEGHDEDAPVPESLRDAVLARAGRCGAETEELLRAAAVVGDAFALDQAADLVGIAPHEAARRAERALVAGLVEESGPGYEFANDVVRDVLYDSTPRPTRILQHRRLAGLLADRPDAAGDHAAAAGEWRDAVDLWVEAASRAATTFAAREAAALLERAKEACARLDDPQLTARVSLARGRVLPMVGEYEAASADLAIALQLATALGDAGLRGEAVEHLGWAAYFTGDVERARELSERAVSTPEPTPGALTLAGRVRHTRGDLAGAMAALERVVGAGDPGTRAVGLSYLGSVLEHADRFDEAALMLDEAADACHRHAALRPLLNALFFGGMAHGNRGHFGVALERFERLEREATRYEAGYFRSRIANSLAWVWRELGEAERARDLADEAADIGDAAGPHSGQDEPWANALLALAESAILAGDEADAAHRLEQVDHVVALGGVRFSWRVGLRRAELAARLDPSLGEHLLQLAREQGSAKYEALALGHMGRCDEATAAAQRTSSDWLLARVGPPELARSALDRMAARVPPGLRDGFLRRGPIAAPLQ